MCTVLHCNGNIIFEKPLDFMHCVASRFGYPNYRLSELSLVPISSDNRRSTIYIILFEADVTEPVEMECDHEW